MIALYCTYLFLVLGVPAQDQESGRKPVLIRVDDDQQREEEVKPEPDIKKARKAVQIGNFYYKRENYKAAELRYREAVLYGPEWSEGYEKLVKTLETVAQYDEAIQVCHDFLLAVPESGKATDFERRLNALKEKQK